MTCPPGEQARRAAAISHSVLALSLQHQRSVSRKYLPSARREGEGWRRERALDAAAAAAKSRSKRDPLIPPIQFWLDQGEAPKELGDLAGGALQFASKLSLCIYLWAGMGWAGGYGPRAGCFVPL